MELIWFVVLDDTVGVFFVVSKTEYMELSTDSLIMMRYSSKDAAIKDAMLWNKQYDKGEPWS